MAPPTTEKEAQCLVGPLGYWKQHIHLNMLLWPTYLPSFLKWDPEQKKDPQQIQAASANWVT